MASDIGILEIDRIEDVATIEYKLAELPEYKTGGPGEKIILFPCINRTGVDCYIAMSVADTTNNNIQFDKIMKRIHELEPFGDKCQLSIKTKIPNPNVYTTFKVSVGLTSDLTSSYDYEFVRNKE